MKKITKGRLEQLAGLADELPERYREAAFAELLRHELASSPSREVQDARADGESKEGKAGEAPTSVSLPDGFAEVYRQLPEQHLVASGTRDGQAAWALVELYRRGEQGTVAALRKLIKDVLGVTPEGRTHMSARLGSDFTPKYATRYLVDKGQGYRYEPTRKIVELFPRETEAD